MICVINGLIDVLEEKLDGNANQLVGYDTVEEIDVALSDGTCAGAILSDLLIRSARYEENLNCALNAEANVVTFGLAMPVTNELQALISTAMSYSLFDGTYDELEKIYNDKKFPGYESFSGGECKEDPDNESFENPLVKSRRFLVAGSPVANAGNAGSTSASGSGGGGGDGDEFKPLSIRDLIAPISISVIATTLAVSVFLWKIYSRRYFEVTHQGIRDDALFENAKKDAELKEKLLALTASELIDILCGMEGIDEDDIRVASDFLPDTSVLAMLIFDHECSQVNRDLIYLRNLSILDLVKLLKQALKDNEAILKVHRDSDAESSSSPCPSDSSNYRYLPSLEDIVDAANDINDPKRKLIGLILSSDDVRASLYVSDENMDAFDEIALAGFKPNVRVSNDRRSSVFSQGSLRSEVSTHRPKPFKIESIVQFS